MANAPTCPLRGTSHAGKGSLISRSSGGSLQNQFACHPKGGSEIFVFGASITISQPLGSSLLGRGPSVESIARFRDRVVRNPMAAGRVGYWWGDGQSDFREPPSTAIAVPLPHRWGRLRKEKSASPLLRRPAAHQRRRPLSFPRSYSKRH